KADLDGFGGGWRKEGRGRVFARGLVHHLRPDRQHSVGTEGLRINGGALIESGPDHTGAPGGVADKPVVGEVVFGAGFARDGVVAEPVFFPGLGRGAVLEAVGQHGADLVGRVAVDGLFLVLGDVGGVNHVAEAVANAGNDVGLLGPAA